MPRNAVCKRNIKKGFEFINLSINLTQKDGMNELRYKHGKKIIFTVKKSTQNKLKLKFVTIF